jgi:uncharacterized damage-inducible protein DinB
MAATASSTPTGSTEREDFIAILANQRKNFLIALRGITDEQARQRTTVSELTLGGLLKHIVQCEQNWVEIMLGRGPAKVEMEDWDADAYRMTEKESVAELTEQLHRTVEQTEQAMASLPSLDATVTLPVYPWSPPEPEVWSARRILLHILREIAHHSGHADIIREELDGASTTAQMAEG